MKKLYIVFDKLPTKNYGGLIATYVNLTQLLKNDYEIVLLSVFSFDELAKEDFKDFQIISLSKFNIDDRFYKIVEHLKNLDFVKVAYAAFSCLYFFLYIPLARYKTKRIIDKNDVVIACAPAAAIFIHKSIQFILEIHTKFEYFWGQNFIGRLQSTLMTKPVLTLFRNKSDAMKAKKLFNSSFIYNYVNYEPYSIDDYDYEKRKNRILFMGRLSEQKNPLRLIECAKILKGINNDFILDIYGEGPLRNAMKSEIYKNHLENNVFLKGFVNDKKIYENYSILWLTSNLEGFGLVIVEAKANMVPTISVNWGDAVYEVIDNSKDGFVANTNEELVEYTMKLLLDEEKLKSFAKSALMNYYNNYSKDTFEKKWIYILENYKNKGVDY